MAELKMDFTEMTKAFVEAVKEQGMFVSWWIPVTEREPEKYGEYLITWEYKDGCFISIAEYEKLSEWLLDDYIKLNYKGAKVIAWMPLPELYKGGDDDDRP